MSSAKRQVSRRARASWSILGCALWVCACDDGGVCPRCPPTTAGGESSDFGGGSAHPCTSVEEKTLIDVTTAAELGFDVSALEGRVEREIDETLHWTLGWPEFGGLATGYEPETRIRGHVTIRSYSYVSLNPEACSGTRCIIFEEEWHCSDRLELGIDAEYSTSDGAVAAVARGYVLQGRPGEPFESPAGSVFTNLRDVRGTLRVFPGEGTIVWANLIAGLRFEEERTEGELLPWIELATGAGTGATYLPLIGQWPIPPTEVEPPIGIEEVIEEQSDL